MSLVRQIGTAIERVGYTEVSRRSGVPRVSLYRCFSKNGNGKAMLATVDRVLPALGLELVLQERGQ